MQISQIVFNVPHENHHIVVKLDLDDDETINLQKWSELYQNAQNAHLPYYWVSINIIKNQKEYIGKCYDGISFHKCKLEHLKFKKPLSDPLTGSEILKTHHIFFNCFDISQNIPSPIPLTSFSLSPFHFSDVPESLVPFCVAGMNTSGALNPKTKLDVGKCQFIVANALSKSEKIEIQFEAIRWMTSSAQKGIKEAQDLLNNKDSEPPVTRTNPTNSP